MSPQRADSEMNPSRAAATRQLRYWHSHLDDGAIPQLQKAANDPGREVAGTITKAQVEEIANQKMPDLNAIDLEGAMQQVEGTARSMGIKVV